MTTEQENFFILDDILEISNHGIDNSIDLSITDDESFLLADGTIVHNSAIGSLNQKRNSKSDGTYALRGKIKNPKRISGLATNSEILDLMNILDLEPKELKNPKFKKIVIATDADPDGDHIASILINLFYKWFPNVINNGHLYKLIPPLVSSGTGKNMDYFYSLAEFQEWSKKNRPSNVRYLKGLGSMSVDDWEWTMAQRRMFKIYADRSADRYLDIAFGSSSKKRKDFLSN
jgi:DNA gyrase/topoisomerase IV subunit B